MSSRSTITLWDWPLRAFHWLLAFAVIALIVSGHVGGLLMPWHGRLGLWVIGLLAFRLAWGVIGSTYARFTHFFPTPGRLRTYLRGEWSGLGHTPLAALSVFTLLVVLALQAITGLFANDDIAFEGPLYPLVSDHFSERVTGIHHLLGNVLLALVSLHVAAIAFYWLVKKKNLLGPMFTGKVEAPVSRRPTGGHWKALLAALCFASLAVGFIVFVATPTPTAAPPAAAPAW